MTSLRKDIEERFSPIFIVGTSRSGTTMVNRALGNHSDILGMNELHFFGTIWDPFRPATVLSREKWRLMAAGLLARVRRGIWGGEADEKDLGDAELTLSEIVEKDMTQVFLFACILQKEADGADKRYVTEQTPSNIFYAPKLLELYRNARILHLVRDPRAVLFSQKNRWRQKWLGASHIPMSNAFRVFVNYHPITMTKIWEKAFEIGKSLDAHPRYRRVRYEDLVANPEREIDGICGFLGIPFEEKMLDVPQVGSSHARHNGEKRGISPDGVNRWQDRLPKNDAAICEFMAGDKMREFGYEPIFDNVSYNSLIAPALWYPFHIMGVALANPRRAIARLKAFLSITPKESNNEKK
jgi:hypothetical protein